MQLRIGICCAADPPVGRAAFGQGQEVILLLMMKIEYKLTYEGCSPEKFLFFRTEGL